MCRVGKRILRLLVAALSGSYAGRDPIAFQAWQAVPRRAESPHWAAAYLGRRLRVLVKLN
eukprot:SAG11_NODE_1221_length_5486_cov_7.177650_2_plen_60_part_00